MRARVGVLLRNLEDQDSRDFWDELDSQASAALEVMPPWLRTEIEGWNLAPSATAAAAATARG